MEDYEVWVTYQGHRRTVAYGGSTHQLRGSWVYVLSQQKTMQSNSAHNKKGLSQMRLLYIHHKPIVSTRVVTIYQLMPHILI